MQCDNRFYTQYLGRITSGVGRVEQVCMIDRDRWVDG